MCRVPSAARREKIQITKCKCSTILWCCTVSLAAPDSPLPHARRFNETDLERRRRRQESCGKNKEGEAKLLSENQCNPVIFRAPAIKPAALVSVAPLSGKHKQAWCVDYKHNPLIITERMEDFDERGKSRH